MDTSTSLIVGPLAFMVGVWITQSIANLRYRVRGNEIWKLKRECNRLVQRVWELNRTIREREADIAVWRELDQDDKSRLIRWNLRRGAYVMPRESDKR